MSNLPIRKKKRQVKSQPSKEFKAGHAAGQQQQLLASYEEKNSALSSKVTYLEKENSNVRMFHRKAHFAWGCACTGLFLFELFRVVGQTTWACLILAIFICASGATFAIIFELPSIVKIFACDFFHK